MERDIFDEEETFPEDFLAADDDIFADDKRDLTGMAVCVGCGCSDLEPCPGGCVWATPELCSRCV